MHARRRSRQIVFLGPKHLAGITVRRSRCNIQTHTSIVRSTCSAGITAKNFEYQSPKKAIVRGNTQKRESFPKTPAEAISFDARSHVHAVFLCPSDAAAPELLYGGRDVALCVEPCVSSPFPVLPKTVWHGRIWHNKHGISSLGGSVRRITCQNLFCT